jgi:phage terminase small subunit
MTDRDVAGRIPPTGSIEIPPPPDGLSAAAAALWRDTLGRFAFHATELALVTSALRSLDRAERAREVVEAEGLTVTTDSTGATRAHPAIRVEAESRREFRLTWRTLGLVDAKGPDR